MLAKKTGTDGTALQFLADWRQLHTRAVRHFHDDENLGSRAYSREYPLDGGRRVHELRAQSADHVEGSLTTDLSLVARRFSVHCLQRAAPDALDHDPRLWVTRAAPRLAVASDMGTGPDHRCRGEFRNRRPDHLRPAAKTHAAAVGEENP